MKQATKRLISFLVGLTALAGAFAVYLYAIVPAYETAQKTKSEILSRSGFIETQQKVIAEVKNKIAEYSGNVQAQEVVSLSLPLSANTADALAQINGILGNNGLSPQAISLSAAPVNQPATRPRPGETASLVKDTGILGFKIRLTGSYESFKSFLNMLETNVRILDVQNAVVQPAGKPNQDLYAFDLTVATYYQKQ